MVDAKLIAVTLTIGMVVSIALTYVATRSSRADAVEYTDDWGKRMKFICSEQADENGCMISMCTSFMDGYIDEDTPLRIDCKDGSSRSASLHDLGNNEDWYERAMGGEGNTQAPYYATDEWCAATDGQQDVSGYDFSSGDEENHSCAAAVAVLAASINAEYTRFVTRAHIQYFKRGFDMFCALDKVDGVTKGCADAEFGFGFSASFEAVCKDGQIATFSFLKTVAELDKLAEDGASEEEITTFIVNHCPPSLDGDDGGEEGEEGAAVDEVDVNEAPACVDGCMNECIVKEGATTCSCAASCDQASCDDDAKAYIAGFVSEKCGGRRLSLSELLKEKKRKSGLNVRAQENIHMSERELGWHVHWPHAHWPHSHSPHGHSPHHHDPHGHAPNHCPGCGNICGNACFGRCGAGCQRWNACGGNGDGAHRACVEHDFECSCGSMTYKTCVGLMWSGDMNARAACRAGNNIFGDKNACDRDGQIFSEMGIPGWVAAIIRWLGASVGFEAHQTWYINSAVRNWGKNFGNLGAIDNGRACQRVQMSDAHGGKGYGPSGTAHGDRYAGPFVADSHSDKSRVLDDGTIAGGSWSAHHRGDSKNRGTCDSWELPWYLNWMC